ncbi:hypothetical protein DSCO28_70770 [Desulfosarcina ovata subsp. sediminis]|uniref:Lipoprotein n=1 Tax=Desulfosarcina ovata subsp. sediminis TaxID=885957 RepID=A0A5K8A241_9BACT|nr:hypothetical protein [Desulfosarcina ovata]BBO86511.1 hypothetical protein DSCO28_70770 [Desulfosarcina ovata subsp. sediminis]
MNPQPLHRPRVFLSGLLFVAIFLSACTTAPQRLDPHFGEYLEAGISAQIVNPDAPMNPAPADTLPGDLAGQIYKKRYVKSMTEEKKENENASSQLSGLD